MWLCNCSLSLSMPWQLQKCTLSDQRPQAIKALPCSPSSPTITAQKHCLPDSNPHSTRVRGEKAKLSASSLEVWTNICLHLLTFNTKHEIWSLTAILATEVPVVTCNHSPCSTLWELTHLPACWMDLSMSLQRCKKPPLLGSSKLKARAVTHQDGELHGFSACPFPSKAKGSCITFPSSAHPPLAESLTQSCSPAHSTNLLTFTRFSWLYIIALLSERGMWKDVRRRKRMWNAVSKQTIEAEDSRDGKPQGFFSI